jgi:hypothetical protein
VYYSYPGGWVRDHARQKRPLNVSQLFVLPLENATLRMRDILYNPIVMQYSHYVQLVQKKKKSVPITPRRMCVHLMALSTVYTHLIVGPRSLF